MSARREDDKGAMEKIGTRVRQRALSGTEASTIGFVLVAYIGAFAGLGYWLDTLFKTSWIVAVGVLLGAAVGFREMFRIANKVTRESIADDREKSTAQFIAALKSDKDLGLIDQPNTEISKPQPQEHPRPRIFSVPPPPSASFEKGKALQGRSQSIPAANSDVKTDAIDEPDGDEELIARLLDEKEDVINDDIK